MAKSTSSISRRSKQYVLQDWRIPTQSHGSRGTSRLPAVPCESMASSLPLPQELQDLIFLSLGNRDFKALRLTCKRLYKCTTLLLFRKFVLYPHLRSFSYLANIASAGHLRDCVNELQYDVSWMDNVEDEILALRCQETSPKRQRQLYTLQEQQKTQTLWCTSEALSTKKAAELLQSIQRLSNLKCLVIHGRSQQAYEDHNLSETRPQFYEQILHRFHRAASTEPRKPPGSDLVYQHDQSFWHAQTFLVAVLKVPSSIRSLHVLGDLRQIFGRSDWSFMIDALPTLNSLETVTLYDTASATKFAT